MASRSLSHLVMRPKAKINSQFAIIQRYAHNQPFTYDSIRERIMLILNLFDKIDNSKLKLDSHFIDDLGLDSLDQVEIVMHIEDEFLFEIPDKDAERFQRPIDIIKYLTDKEEAYEELQKLQAASHHGHGHDVDHHAAEASHGHGHGESHNHTNGMNTTQKREFSSLTTISKRYLYDPEDPEDKKILDKAKKMPLQTSFETNVLSPPDYDDICARVMKVCSKYDKIDASKLDLASHFVDDLGLDSLDHVEIIMELEDEFGEEIPDKDAEKLMRPTEIARYIFEKLTKSQTSKPTTRHY